VVMGRTPSLTVAKVELCASVGGWRDAWGVRREVEAELVAGREGILGKRDLSGA
jgi:hypothetical protein